MQRIISQDDCLREDLLAYISFPPNPNETVCFPIPQYCIYDDVLTQIDPSVFPDNGNVISLIQAGNNASDVREQYKDVCIIRFNIDKICLNPEPNKPSKYVAHLNMKLPSGRSEIEFKKFGSHPIAKRLMQVIPAEGLSTLDRTPEGFTFQVGPVSVITEYALLLYHGKDRDRLAGPFATKSVGKDGLVNLYGSEQFDYRIYDFVGKPTESILAIHDQDNNPAFSFVDSNIIIDAISTKGFNHVYDWLPDTKLVNTMNMAIGLSDELREYSKNAKRRLKRGLESVTNEVAGFKVDDGRRERMYKLASNVESFSELPERIQDSVFENMDSEQLADIVLAPRNFPRFKSQILEIPELQAAAEEKAEALNAEVEQLEALKTEELKKLESVQNDLIAAKDDLAKYQQQAVEAKSKELEELERKCNKLTKQCADLTDSINELEDNKRALSEQLDRLVKLLDDKVELSAEILKSEVVQRVISLAGGVSTKSSENAQSIDSPVALLPESENKQLVDHLFDVVAERSGRSYQRNDIINFYICLTQGYITTFAGMPGTGKTSLCRLLAQGLGLNSANNSRFVELSVERGWASFRDYIGYYNPLTKTEELSNQEVFDMLARLTEEHDSSPEEIAPCILLLDEANLSPIEHYWAPFLRACDSFDKQSTILSIGGNRSLILPQHTRFVATVNYDHTTEELSPRFLDRTWVIMLNPEEILDPDDNTAEDESETGMVSYANLIKTFGRRKATIMDAAIEGVLADTVRACANHRHPISPRSQNMMRGFIGTACDLMETNTVAARFDPVDFAVAQKVLPSISGPRETCEDLLDELASICSDLPRTTRIIDNMKSAGESSGYFQFFA